MNYNGQFADSVEEVLNSATEIALRYGCNQVGTEHIL